MAHPPASESTDMGHNLTRTRSNHHDSGRRNTTKVFVVMYPSNATSTVILTTNTNHTNNKTSSSPTNSYGFGICVKPKKKRNAKFWTESGPEPILFTVEDYGQDGLTMRSGHGVDEENMVLRILVAEKDDFTPSDSAFEDCFTPLVEAGKRRADTAWITDCLRKLQDKNLVPAFELDSFANFVRALIEENEKKGLFNMGSTRSQSPVTVNYLEHLAAIAAIAAAASAKNASSNAAGAGAGATLTVDHRLDRRESFSHAVFDRLRRTHSSYSPKGSQTVLRLT